MRCLSCNKNLSNKESTRKSVVTDEYLDLCDDCLSTIADDVAYIEGNCTDESEFEAQESEGEETEGEDW